MMCKKISDENSIKDCQKGPNLILPNPYGKGPCLDFELCECSEHLKIVKEYISAGYDYVITNDPEEIKKTDRKMYLLNSRPSSKNVYPLKINIINQT